MEQTKVKIIGLSLNNQLGILKAQRLTFSQDNRLILIKGAVGSGKTTVQTALKLGTQGQKTLKDNQLYGDVDQEVQLLDGDTRLFVGIKSKENKLIYTMYEKDEEGKKKKTGHTPAAYLNALQTKLTWRLDELTSENPKVQRDILLELYQKDLIDQGVIFDKKHPEYKKSILGKIDAAIEEREYCQRDRTKKGGIREDLVAHGVDPDRPESVPDAIDLIAIETKIKGLEKDRTIYRAKIESTFENDQANIEISADKLRADIRLYNSDLKNSHSNLVDAYEQSYQKKREVEKGVDSVVAKLFDCLTNKSLNKDNHAAILVKLKESVIYPKVDDQPKAPKLIIIDPESNKIDRSTLPVGHQFETDFNKLVELYKNSKLGEIDTSVYDNEIVELNDQKTKAIDINKTVAAVDSFHAWRKANELVVRLKGDYVKMLQNIDTGVEGMHIVPNEEGSELFLMYNGAYDTDYFNNPNKELRKLASYSDTQKPVICLLVQNYLLSNKSKAMRYLFIDKVPIDKGTRDLLEQMATNLDLTLIVNWTGDFDKEALIDGEFLIEGGEIFF